MQTLIDLFSLKGLIPHGYCLACSPLLLWLTIISDTLITLCYYVIPIVMFYFVRPRKDLLYSKIVVLIALFIVACGTTHLISLITIWIPVYGMETISKVITAVLSVITTFSMLSIIPKVLSLNSAEKLQQEIAKRLITEKALWESNNKLNTILDNIPAHIALKDTNYNYLYINKAVEDYFGLKKENIIGLSCEALFADEFTQKMIHETDCLVSETGQPVEYEFVEQKYQHTFLRKKSPLFDESGSIYALCVFALDITDAKTMTQQLHEKDLMWKFAIEGVGDGLWDWNMQTNDVYFSPIWKGMLGYHQDELMNTIDTWQDLLHAEDKASATKTLKAYLNGNTEYYRNEFRLRCKNGLYKWILARGMVINKDDDGKPLRMIGTHSDISLRKETEKQLTLSDTALNMINQGVVISDSTQQITWTNKAFEELTGYQQAEILGKTCRFLQGPLSAPETIKQIKIALDKQKNFFGDIINYRKDGTIFWQELTILPIVNAQAKLTNFMSISRDITEQKKLESDLRQGQRQAEQANQVKSQFLAMMSHEIRTPLNAILGMQDLLINTPLNTQQAEYLKYAAEGGALLLRLINDILDLTKVESGKLALETLDFDAASFIEVCMELLAPKAQEKGLELHTIIAPEVDTWISGDPYRFRQIILNLVSNAIKFTEKGSVTVKLSADSSSDKTCLLLVEVIDTGIGIPEDLQSGLFEVFVQADPSDTRKYGGSGLGLAISKRLINLWGGQIGLDSTPYVGSRFWFTVGTLAAKPKQTPMIKALQEGTNTANTFCAHILLVEDSLINQAVMAAMLRNAGHLVDLADSGTKGIEAASEKHYDIILMDVSMPDMSGMEATAIIRQLGGAAALVPIIAITAHALAGYQEMCLASGMNGYATKPISQKDLLALVTTWCNQTASEKASATIPLVNSEAIASNNAQPILLDNKTINELTAQFGKKETNNLLKIYITELQTRCITIKQAIIKQDLEILGREAHTIKSSSATFGATTLQAIAKELEATAYNNDLTKSIVLTEQLLACAETTLAIIALRYNKKQGGGNYD
jgi:PAS domain S-box-containing protein